MTQPLAIICADNMAFGNKLAHRLQELGYRVMGVTDRTQLVNTARTSSPLVVISELRSRNGDPLSSIRELKNDETTRHIPILAYTPASSESHHNEALAAGVSLVAMESGILLQLPQLLETVLAVE